MKELLAQTILVLLAVLCIGFVFGYRTGQPKSTPPVQQSDTNLVARLDRHEGGINNIGRVLQQHEAAINEIIHYLSTNNVSTNAVKK